MTFAGPKAHQSGRRAWRLLAGVAASLLLVGPLLGTAPVFGQARAPTEQLSRAAQSSLDKARGATARGDLRTAQIELRNAVRSEPNSGMLRFLLAELSLDIADFDTAEKEARAAIERGYQPAASTALLLRTYLSRGRFRELLRDFPLPTDLSTPPAVAAQVGSARVAASMANNDREAAKLEFAALRQVAPNAPETHLAEATVALAENRRDDMAAAVDRALAADPDHPEALLRKTALLLESNDRAAAIAALDRLLTRNPNMLQARLIRAEILLRAGQDARAREDVDAALRTSPGSVQALYQKAFLQVRAQDWRGADETLTKFSNMLPNFPDGLLLLATVKRALNQTEQALDAAQRHVARRPEDSRGANMLATMELERRQPAAAAGVLERLVQRGSADTESFEILSRALLAAGRPREAAEVAQRLAERLPDNSLVLTRLAAARLASGDSAAAMRASQEALKLQPDAPGAREVLVLAALSRGELDLAEAELAKLPAQQRQSEMLGVAEGTLRVARRDLVQGKAAFEDVLRRHPQSAGARLGLARMAARSGDGDEALRQWTEALKTDPNNSEALGAVALVALAGGPRGATARGTLETVQRAHPAAPAPAITLANLLIRSGEAEEALRLLDTAPLREGPLSRGPMLPLLRAEANASLRRWPAAEAAARTALADDPDNSIARRALAIAMLRNGDARGAEELLQLGLRRRGGDPILQGALLSVVFESRGLDAALAQADAMARFPDGMPNAAILRGDLLLGAGRAADAARDFAATYAANPSALLAQRTAAAWQEAGDLANATAALEAWLRREPQDSETLSRLAQIDLVAGRREDAARRLASVIDTAPTNAVALNNLAWTLTERGTPEDLARARGLAERAYFLFPSAETADTLGWALVRSGEAARGLPLLREANASRRIARQASSGEESGQDPGMAYRLAVALDATGDKAGARAVLEPVLANAERRFPERADAEKLLAMLRGGG